MGFSYPISCEALLLLPGSFPASSRRRAHLRGAVYVVTAHTQYNQETTMASTAAISSRVATYTSSESWLFQIVLSSDLTVNP